METEDVKNCPRCGADHNGLELRKFAKPIMPDVLNWGWEHWSTCPVTGDPILTSRESWIAAGNAHGHWEWVKDPNAEGSKEV